MVDGPYRILFAAEASGRRVTSREPLLLVEYSVSVRTLTSPLLPNEALELVSADQRYRSRISLAQAEKLTDGRTRVRFGAVLLNTNYSLFHFANGQVQQTVFANIPLALIHSAGQASTLQPSAHPSAEAQSASQPPDDVDTWLV
jgi:hypothetical protein